MTRRGEPGIGHSPPGRLRSMATSSDSQAVRFAAMGAGALALGAVAWFFLRPQKPTEPTPPAAPPAPLDERPPAPVPTQAPGGLTPAADYVERWQLLPNDGGRAQRTCSTSSPSRAGRRATASDPHDSIHAARPEPGRLQQILDGAVATSSRLEVGRAGMVLPPLDESSRRTAARGRALRLHAGVGAGASREAHGAARGQERKLEAHGLDHLLTP